MKFLLVLVITILSLQVHAQQFTPDNAKSKVSFVIKNMGIDVDGSVKGLSGNINFNPKNIAKSSFYVTADASTVNTDNTKRDNHLQQSDFFDVANYPKITISSSKIESKGGNQYTAHANVKIKNSVKAVTIDFTAVPTGNTYSFKGSFTVNRRDFGLGGNSMTMADNVKINLDIETKKK
ncbi:MAG: polyisoprenoid-binding protein [Chitinophagaceae bacterium]|nr:MAG: polyisoprenoid-binding protein [Chitinophagaceae bacterium]